MPEDPKEHESMSTTVKWLIGGVAAGLTAIGAFIGSWMRESSARQDKHTEYVQQEVDKHRTERVELAKGLHAIADAHAKQAEAQRLQTKATQDQTSMIVSKLDTLINDTRRGAWREAENAKPEQP